MVFRPAVQGSGPAGPLLPVAMVEDRTGFLWEGGGGGLGRWDGYGFHLYTAGSGPPDGLADHSVLSLHRDAQDRLWVGTVVGGLARYDPATDRFTPVVLDDGSGPATCIWSMDDDRAGGLWVGTSTGLFHIDGAGRVLARLRHGAGLPADKVEVVLLDRQGVLWVGGPGGLAHGLDGNTHFTSVALPVDGSDGPEVLRLLEDGGGRLWIGSRASGAFVIGAGRGPAASIADSAPAPGEAAAADILSIAAAGASDSSDVWLSTAGKGVLVVDPVTLRTRRLRHDPFVPGSLPKDTVSALYRDRSGLLWLGTVQGLSRLDSGNPGIVTLLGDPSRSNGLRANDGSAVLARPDGGLWIGSQDNGLQELDAAGHGSGSIALPPVFAMAAADPAAGVEAPVYIGTRAGLYLADAAGRSAVRTLVPSRLPDAAVNALLVQDGTLWLGGGDDGLWELQPHQGGSLSLLHRFVAPALTNNALYAVAPAPGGRIAVGTDRGFNLVDPATGAVERFVPDPSRPDGLEPGAVMCFAVDRHARLWVGTNSSGIAVLIGRDGAGRPRFRHIGRAEGLQDLDVSKLLVDGQGMIWASTDHGLAEIDPDRFTARALPPPQDVVIATYWSNSGDVTPQGDLVFGGAGGLTIVQPAHVSTWQYSPPVAVTDLKVGGEAVRAGAAGVATGSGPILISPDANSLAVEFAALDFSAPELNRYSYRLSGFDRSWVDTDATHRVAIYTNLPPGDFTLLLRGSNRDGDWGRPAALQIRVLPAWYQTRWFRLAAAAAVLLAVAALVQGRTMILRQRQCELERQVAERTAELRASQQQLEELVYLDPLTSLPNRRAFTEQLERLTGASPAETFSLVLVDLDGFKTVNDQFGHQAGDLVLGVAADRLRHAVRTHDSVYRLGGDEFAVLVRDVEDPGLVDGICARIVGGVGTPLALEGRLVTIGASAGATLYPRHGRTQDELYRHVDLALYEAKSCGRGTWRWYGGSPSVPSAQRVLL
jgi:diguanylate cyclase (GGDEF)-like protein